MRETITGRAVRCASFIKDTGATVRETAAHFGLSKSTVHKDVTVRLIDEDAVLFETVRAILDNHKALRHLRGGEATRRKYKRLSEQKARGKGREHEVTQSLKNQE